MSNLATVTRTAKGYRIVWADGGRVSNVGAAYTHVVLYATGGWNPDTKKNDLSCMTRHKSLEGAFKAFQPGGQIVTLPQD